MPHRLRLLALSAASLALPAAAFFVIDRNIYAHEYANSGTGRYVLLVDAAEVADGRAGPGWYATGHRFSVAPAGGGGTPVCRFYAPVSNTHFFTAAGAECEALKAPGSGWVYEKVAFDAYVPGGGTCVGMRDVHRLYNNVPGRPIHRYVSSIVTRSDLVTEGWVDEGVAFCAPAADHLPESRASAGTTIGASLVPVPASACPAAGSCVALGGLPAMTRSLSPYLPPSYFDANPEFPAEARRLTGDLQNLHTAVTSTNAGDVAAHSYVGAGGIFINGADRLDADLASASAAFRFGEAETVRPWEGAIPRELRLRFFHRVNVLEAPAGTHAYGHPALTFRDRASGLRFEVTVQTFGTVPPAEFAGVVNGRVLVSTVLGSASGFGRSLYAYEHLRSAPGQPRGADYRMDRAAFATALARARAIEPRLSPDPADYAMEAFAFKVETYLDARVGVTFGQVDLEVVRD